MDPHLVAPSDRDGFLLIRGLLPPNALEEFAEGIARWIRNDLSGLPDSQAKYLDQARPETLYDLRPEVNAS